MIQKNNIESICVFCGSRSGLKSRYKDAAVQLGYLIAEKGLTLVYGGGNIGLMGAIASSAQTANCNILGVIPEHLMKKEVGKTNLKNLRVTDNMHERKSLMYDKSDAFIVLPGGVGTLDEFFEILTWSQLNLHKKPIVLINTDSFWDPLLNLIKHQIHLGFMDQSINSLFTAVPTPESAINYLLASKRQLSPE